MKYVCEPGELTLMVGNASDHIVEQKTIQLVGKPTDWMGKRKYTTTAYVK